MTRRTMPGLLRSAGVLVPVLVLGLGACGGTTEPSTKATLGGATQASDQGTQDECELLAQYSSVWNGEGIDMGGLDQALSEHEFVSASVSQGRADEIEEVTQEYMATDAGEDLAADVRANDRRLLEIDASLQEMLPPDLVEELESSTDMARAFFASVVPDLEPPPAVVDLGPDTQSSEELAAFAAEQCGLDLFG